MAGFDEGSYAARGYGVVRQALPHDTVRALRDELERLQTASTELDAAHLVFEKDLSAAGRKGVPAQAVGNAAFIVGDLYKFSPVFRALPHLPTSIDAAAAALGTRELVAHFMNATIKHPKFGRAIGWHRDFPNDYLCGEDASFVRLMFCLDGMTLDGGATRFLPGSHMVSDAQAQEERRSGLKPVHDALAGEPALCGPGDMVVIHPKVVHGGPMNLSAHPRRNIVLQVGVRGVPLHGERESITGIALARAP